MRPRPIFTNGPANPDKNHVNEIHAREPPQLPRGERPFKSRLGWRPGAATLGVQPLDIRRHVDAHWPAMFDDCRSKLGPRFPVRERIAPGRLDRQTGQSVSDGIVFTRDVNRPRRAFETDLMLLSPEPTAPTCSVGPQHESHTQQPRRCPF